jgi:hypothetical protein
MSPERPAARQPDNAEPDAAPNAVKTDGLSHVVSARRLKPT